jgi:glycosyltransferase involved in cell wall biosynthesis
MRFHLLGLAHLPCSREYISCAFTQKNYKLSQMLMDLGHEVIYYGAEGSDLPCTKFFKTHDLRDIAIDYGDGDNRFALGYDWHRNDFRHDLNAQRKPSTLKYYEACIELINKIKRPDDFLLLTQGYYHKPISDAVGLFLSCESGVGYRGSFSRFRAFESSYIQNFTYGSQNPFKSINGHYYDRVIPNYFDPDDFIYGEKPGDYYLFIGRIIQRKGLDTAIKTCNAIGKKLIIAGQAATVDGNGYLNSLTEPGFRCAPGTWEYVGFADLETRKKLMAGAIATFVPTVYLEPFAGVHIESMLSGAPPITTNFGVFPETIPDVLNGKVGFRCNTLNDFVVSAMYAPRLKRDVVRKYAERFLMNTVSREFNEWFDDLYRLYESTVDPDKKGWHRITAIR